VRKELHIPTLPWVKRVPPKESKCAGRRSQRGGFLIVNDLQHLRGGAHLHLLYAPSTYASFTCYTQCAVLHALCTPYIHASVLDKASINAFNSVYAFDPACHLLVFKPVTKKVRTVPTAMPAEYGVVHQLPTDPLAGLPPLPSHACKCADKLDLDPAKWLCPEELKLVQWLVHAHECAFTWNASE
jgi:hypothetical protein